MRSALSSDPVRVALLGTGVIAGPHITALKTLNDVEVAAVCDLEETKARTFAQQNGIPLVFEDLDTMLERVSPDVVHVLLPPIAHANATERCVRAGSHVFVEKPICVSLEECRRVERAAHDAGRQVGVDHNLLFMPSFVRMLDIIRACRIGALQHVRVMYNLLVPALAAGPHAHWMFGATGNVMLEIGPHPISVICRLLGKVTAASTAVSGELILSNGVRFFRTWQSSLVCERGDAQCVLSLGDGYPNTTIHVIGQDGEIWVDLARNTVRLSEKTRYLRTGQLVDGWKSGYQLVSQSIGNFWGYAMGAAGLRPPYLMQNFSVNNSIAAFYSALRAGRAPVIGATEGTMVVEACHMVIDSALLFLGQKESEHVANR